jgi:hypothetical protein
LHSDCTLDRIDHRRKLKQHAVTRRLHEATAVFCHEGVGDLAVFAQRAGGADLVKAHEPRVAGDVGCDDCGQPASNTIWLPVYHGQARALRPCSHERASILKLYPCLVRRARRF